MQFFQRLFPAPTHSEALKSRRLSLFNAAPSKTSAVALKSKTCEPATGAAAAAAAANDDGWTLKALSTVHRTATVCTPPDVQQQCMDLHPSMELTAADTGAAIPPLLEAGAAAATSTRSTLDLELSPEEAVCLVQPLPLAIDSAPAASSPAPEPAKPAVAAGRQLQRLLTTPRTLMRQASDGLRRSGKRLRASLSSPACFTGRARHSTFAPTTAEGWTKTHVNWA